MGFTKGEQSLFYIKKDDIWFPVGCLIGSPLSEESDVITTTTRDNEGWETIFPTTQRYSFELSGMLVKDDEDSGNSIISFRELLKYKRNKTLIEWKRVFENGWYVDSGKAYIISISDLDNAGEFISFSASLKGYGKPNESDERLIVLGFDSNGLYSDYTNTIINTQ